MLGDKRKIHFVGIGGIGMSGIAELLFNLDHIITGSDIKESDRTKYLKDMGIKITIGHSEKNVIDTDLVVYSSAVALDNCEIIKAKKINVPIIRRAEMLGELLKVKERSIAVAGTHGKTTTSSMLSLILDGNNSNPTVVVGGIVQEFQSNSKLGTGDTIIVEADEYDRTLLSLNPTMSIVTNIDLEHIDCYPNIEVLKETFLTFLNSVPFYGINIICYDDENIKSILNEIKRPYIKYGKSIECDVRYKNPVYKNSTTSFILIVNNIEMGEIVLSVPGEHNILNSLAAIGIALELNISFDIIKRSLFKYNGVKRRFEVKHVTSNNITIVDDYAHHPSEVKATINSARDGWDVNNLIVVFQPHLYSRTQSFYKEFSDALSYADTVFLTDIYPAREEPIKGVTSKLISNELDKLKTTNYLLDKDKIPNCISDIVMENDMLIVMGAGDIKHIIDDIHNNIINSNIETRVHQGGDRHYD